MWSSLTKSRGHPGHRGTALLFFPMSPISFRSTTRFDGDPVGELKAWSRRVWWAGHDTPRQKARAIAELTAAPWRFVQEFVRVFPLHAPCVSRRAGVSGARQLFEIIWARLRYGLDPIAYYRFQLFRPERWARAGRYVQAGDAGRVLRWLVATTPGYVFVFGDKRRFEAWCTEHGLPVVRTLIEFEGGRVVRALAADQALPAADLFSKPSNSQSGLDTARWLYRGGAYVGSDGGARSAAALIAELARTSADIGRPILLQRALRNAACDAALSPGGALATARIMTIRQPDGTPQLLYAVYRMPADSTAAADNFSAGGLAAPIDLATGRLGPGIRKDMRLLPEPAVRHPQTGARVEGHQLPHWAEAVRLALRAHEAITWKGVPVIGWDIALLEDGPLLVEGNNVPGSTLPQMVLDVPLGDSPLPACLNAHLRECFSRSSAR